MSGAYVYTQRPDPEKCDTCKASRALCTYLRQPCCSECSHVRGEA